MNKILNYISDQFVFLNLKKISNGYLNLVDAREKEYFFGVSNLTEDYVNFMKENGAANKSFFKGTFLGDDLNFCNEIRGAIEVSISHSKKTE